jgi:hypothetical protein
MRPNNFVVRITTEAVETSIVVVLQGGPDQTKGLATAEFPKIGGTGNSDAQKAS